MPNEKDMIHEMDRKEELNYPAGDVKCPSAMLIA